MSRRHKLTRREFLYLSTLATAGAVATACGAQTPEATTPPVDEVEEPAVAEEPVVAEEPEEPEVVEEVPEPETPASRYNEAPMLAALVAAGQLPPVDERLPLNPLVCPVAEGIGNYGGTIRRAHKGLSDRWGPTKLIDRSLVWVDPDMNLVPRLIESWEWNDDGSVITMHLRKGLKYSDGVEVTSADFQWFYDNFASHPDLQPGLWTKLTTLDEDGNKVMCEAEFPDDYTVVYKFAGPNPLFLYGGLRDINGFFAPGHEMSKYHMDLTDDPDALEAAIAEAGFNSWNEYYEDRIWWYLNLDKPMTTPWLAKNSMAEELFTMERNPYYFAVDPEGNQLPYLDTTTHRLFENNEVFNLWIVNGEVDFQARHVALDNFTLYKQNEASGNYRVFVGVASGHTAMQLNLSTKNDRLREFFNTRDVRIAVSLAMNREEVNELIYDGMLTPRQYSPLEMDANYYPKLSNAYIEYDPDTANQMLDEAGYDQKNAAGFRLWPGTSEEISFIIEGTAEPGSAGEDAAQLVSKYLADVGIKGTYRYFERSLYTEHFEANEIEAAMWGGDRTILPFAPKAPIFRGTMIDRPWAAGYGIWWNSGGAAAAAVEPPAGHFIWDIWEIWAEIEKEPDPDRQQELFKGILDIWAEEIPMIGLLGQSPALIIVKEGFHNYLPGLALDDTTGDEHILYTETYFWDDPAAHS